MTTSRTFRPDPTFYPSPSLAQSAPRETLAYVAVIDPTGHTPDALVVLDLDHDSPTYTQEVGRLDLPHTGDELHHFGWNACSAALCPTMPHPHVERRYLLVPGLRSSRIYVIDTKPDPRQPTIHKTIEPEELHAKSGYSRPHTVHCGPDAVYMNALGAPDGNGPGGVFLLDHNTFDIKGPWEKHRGPQHLAYDFWWHLGHDTMLTSEWGTPNMVEDGLNPEILLAGGYGHALHVWNLRTREHLSTIDLGAEHQMVLELRPAHDPRKTYGFVGVVTSLKDLSASVWVWYLDGHDWKAQKVIEVPAEPADPSLLPPLLQGFGAVPPLITDINLSLDDRFLYVSCWGTGELRQYDVTDPFNPKLVGSVHLGGIVRQAPHPRDGTPLTGGPQMVEISRDGQRVYVTNSLYAAWDAQFYPAGIRGWAAKLDVDPQGGLTVDPDFYVDFGERRAHQVRLQGGDASSDSFCYPNP
ncbi:selenium-binding family protein [Deinococcus maricopensis]|uniref:Methanethiol oxidase n=1 Tax=Deinococcus maricopensis (strain DSM 21211 / LMG 22137 / NRRL B-23946 / LB-34) TaxID=709986 RepID=E8U348_DEIML|nr:selenium-binding family protein [Deinococcus maricopensis]ADV65993.1 selenium-binding protein [Deinococcus maricopensis DSM 21211]